MKNGYQYWICHMINCMRWFCNWAVTSMRMVLIYQVFSSIDLARHFKTDQTTETALSLGYPKTPCLRANSQYGGNDRFCARLGILMIFKIAFFVYGNRN
jgi:hypothetical protein